ncbi:GNAT family N-acetyltransferase [Amycolatopsis jiangsuensis]|uniref:RimJ/RimL family protein N-acetyltransferase n=1 Tax=Amycolatopsis jiangsuensis TaxID=1181879 RepID=A0A840IUL0_9PSEU|nr:GNAT family protein [Amycolatopsis jiangsuensis]MBB4684902.1 RimJ/RimL family protein N-acetyltransferase [Amycolatopsis jiangsuensis]
MDVQRPAAGGPGAVGLRPARESDVDLLEALTNDPATVGEYQWFGWHDPGYLRRRWRDTGLLSTEGGMLVPTAEERPLGLVSWHRTRTGPHTYCWNIGMVLLPEARGHGLGTEAQRLLVRYLFAHTQFNRVEASTEVGNRAEQRSLEKAGFTREGVLRGFDFRDGEWRDHVLYSVVRADLSS